MKRWFITYFLRGFPERYAHVDAMTRQAARNKFNAAHPQAEIHKIKELKQK